MHDPSSFGDDELVVLLNAGDAGAFTEIYARYWKLLFFIASKRLKNYCEAEEAIQEIFTDLWARRATLTINNSLKYYLASAVQYQVMKQLAKCHARTQLHLSDNTSENTADESLGFHMLQKQIEELVMALPEKCRMVYQLSRDAGLKNKTIARHLGISENTVENQLTKALSRIRAGLGDPALVLLVMHFMSKN